MLHALCSPRQDLWVRTEWMFLSSSAEDIGGPKSMCNVSLISKSNRASYAHTSQYKVVMIQIIVWVLFLFFSHRYDLYARLNSGYLLHMLNYANHCIFFELPDIPLHLQKKKKCCSLPLPPTKKRQAVRSRGSHYFYV